MHDVRPIVSTNSYHFLLFVFCVYSSTNQSFLKHRISPDKYIIQQTGNGNYKICDHSNNKIMEWYFHMVLFILLYDLVLILKYVDETSGCDHSSESYLTIIPRVHVGYEMIDSQRGA